MVEMLKDRRINSRLLCEICTHPVFMKLLTNAEIYVDGIATMRLHDLNTMLETIRLEIIRKYQPEKSDPVLNTLAASQIDEEDYFCHVTHKSWDEILHDLHRVHAGDIESAPESSPAFNILKQAEQALRTPGNYLDVFCRIVCKSLDIRYDKLQEKERGHFKNILKKSSYFKNSPLNGRWRR